MEDWIVAQSLFDFKTTVSDTELPELVTYIMARGALNLHRISQNEDLLVKFNTSKNKNQQPATITTVLMCTNLCAWDTSVICDALQSPNSSSSRLVNSIEEPLVFLHLAGCLMCLKKPPMGLGSAHMIHKIKDES